MSVGKTFELSDTKPTIKEQCRLRRSSSSLAAGDCFVPSVPSKATKATFKMVLENKADKTVTRRGKKNLFRYCPVCFFFILACLVCVNTVRRWETAAWAVKSRSSGRWHAAVAYMWAICPLNVQQRVEPPVAFSQLVSLH